MQQDSWYKCDEYLKQSDLPSSVGHLVDWMPTHEKVCYLNVLISMSKSTKKLKCVHEIKYIYKAIKSL